MTEDEAKLILLVRCLEEEAPELVLPEVRAAAARAAGDPTDLPGWLLRRSQFVLERLPDARRTLLAFVLPPADLSLLLLLGAGLLGLLSNGLSTGARIHILANPVTALLLWNLGVFVFLALARLRARSAAAPSRDSSSIHPLLSWLARASVLWARLRGRNAFEARADAADARVRLRFASDGAAACAAPIAARCTRLVHLGAITFALGALGGIYFQGVAFEYRMEWGSTLISDASTRATLAALLFWPARLVLGDGFPGAGDLALAASPEGAPAASWFHVFAISVFAFVMVPRAALATLAGLRARRLGADIVLPLHEPAWRALVEQQLPGGRGPLEKTVLSHFALDADACTVLASLQAELVTDDIRSTSAGGALDTLARKKAWLERWRVLVLRGFEAFPEPGRPQLEPVDGVGFEAVVARVRSSSNPFAAPLVLLELAAFEAYWPFDARDTNWRDRFGLAPSLQRTVREASLTRAANRLGLFALDGIDLRRALSASAREISGLWSKIAIGAAAGTAVGALTAGIAAPFAAPFLGHALGAAGLLAFKAGLAALGGHAVVAAGLGAAGTGLLVGGGGLLALNVGPRGASVSETLTAATALLSSAKIEVFLRRVVALGPEADATFTSIVTELETSVTRLREELPSYRIDPARSSREIRDQERVIEILARVVERNVAWGNRHGIA